MSNHRAEARGEGRAVTIDKYYALPVRQAIWAHVRYIPSKFTDDDGSPIAINFVAWLAEDWDGTIGPGETPAMIYMHSNGEGPRGFPVLPEHAESYIRGYVKWDGCSNFTLEGDHVCTRDEYQRFHLVMERVWDQCTAMMPGSICRDEAQPALEGLPPWERGIR